MKNKITLSFTDNQLNVIYDALTELSNMTDNNKTQNTIDRIIDIIYVANKQQTGNSIWQLPEYLYNGFYSS